MIKHCTAGSLLRIVVPKKEQTLLNYSTSSSQEGLYVLKKIHMDKNKEVDFFKKTAWPFICFFLFLLFYCCFTGDKLIVCTTYKPFNSGYFLASFSSFSFFFFLNGTQHSYWFTIKV